MGSLAQSSWVFSLNSSTGVSFSSSSSSSFQTNTYPSMFLKAGSSRSLRISSSLNNTNSESSPSNSSNDSERIRGDEPETSDPVKLALARAKAYKKALQTNPCSKKDTIPVPETVGSGNRTEGSVAESVDGDTKEVPISVKLAMDKAREYKKNKGITGNAGTSTNVGKTGSDSEAAMVGTSGVGFVEKRVGKKEEPVISSVDFMGLGFSDEKKSKGLPAGLAPLVDPFPDGDLPEVELIVGDSSKFEAPTPSNLELKKEDDLDMYKPKVSTWGVFPRPGNISKTFGGGRTIRPGEGLETAEDKAAKETRTRQLLAAYKKKTGLVIDPKLKSECEKALKDGDCLMDLGKLKEALPYYEKVMKDLTFQTELYGLAALQWSICQDSLSRPNEARVMYERLQSHPNIQVRKRAKQFVFGFQAMEMMKITSSSFSPKTTGYQNYFEAFIEDKPDYTQGGNKDEQVSLTEALPYIMFLVSPIFLVLLIAVRKGT